MADQVLEKANLYFDELNKLKLLKPQYSQASSDLLEKIRLLISSKSVDWAVNFYFCSTLENDDLETFKRDIELKFAELCQLLEEQMLKVAAS
ncbi:hypothetical protein D918_02803 [Trichuris suis]|nr:hypothetical protein D918_02803 [Trichuris suis]